MDPTNFIPVIAGYLHMSGAQLLFWIGFITFTANLAARRIPATATGWLGTIRSIAAFIGAYVPNRIAPGVTSEDVSKASLSFPEVQAKVAAPDAPPPLTLDASKVVPIIVMLWLLPIALMLSSCSALTAATSGQPVATGQVAVDMSKGWYYAESLYNVPAAAYKSTNSRGLVSPSLRATIKPKLILLFQLLTAVKHAKAAGDAATFSAKLSAMETLSSDVKALIPAG